MARFRAQIITNRSEVSRLGHKNTGITATVNGWDIGVRVEARVDEEGQDSFIVYRTGGSNGSGAESRLIVVDEHSVRVN